MKTNHRTCQRTGCKATCHGATSRCLKHLLEMREYNRARYRAANGIPIDAPLSKRGRPRDAK